MQVSLRCMGAGCSPGEIHEYAVPVDTDIVVTQIFEDKSGRRGFRDVTQNDGADAGDRVFARIQSLGMRLILEPLIDGVTVELPPLAKFARRFDSKGIDVPPSTVNTKNYIYLRPDDTFSLSEQGLKVVVAVEDAENTSPLSQKPEVKLEEEILVKSSNIESEFAPDGDGADRGLKTAPDGEALDPEIGVQDDGAESETDDDDLDAMSTGCSTKTRGAAAGEFTPPTGGEPMIKETPHHDANGDNQPYSIAPDQHIDDEQLDDFQDAPKEIGATEKQIESNLTAKLKSAANDNLQTRASDSLTSAIKETVNTSDTADELGSPDKSEDTPSRPAKKTYGRKNGSGKGAQKPAKRRTTVVSMGTSDEDDQDPVVEQAEALVDHEENYTEASAAPPTSENMNSSSVAVEVARRSLSLTSTKRKAPEDADDAPPDTKKRKTRASNTPSSSAKSEHMVKQSSKPKKGRVPRAARESDESEEIAVASRTDRATETENVSTTTLAGKPPKVLLSSESKLNKTTIKWLKEQGADIIDEVMSCRTNFVCVIAGDRIRTVKVLRSVTLGKAVVGEDWVVQSQKAGRLLDTEGFVHEDLKDTADFDRRSMFEGKNLYFTHSLVANVYKDNWEGIQELAKEAGASHVETGDANKFGATQGRNEIIVFGSDTKDLDVGPLINDYGCSVYSKDLLPHSILTGQLDLENERFKLSAGRPGKKGRK